jgi:AcrR family transcriptional regulator
VPPPRTKNPRGLGGRLRDEIVDAATALLEETGSEDAVTLRAVARRAGISAPSIYDHFGGRGELLAAVLARAFAQFRDVLSFVAQQRVRSPRRRVELLAEAYLRFAREQPSLYRVMFSRHRTRNIDEVTQRREPDQLLGSAAFALLHDAVAAATTEDVDPMLAATALWAALHGYATLHEAVPAFPWPDESLLLSRLVASGVGISAHQ